MYLKNKNDIEKMENASIGLSGTAETGDWGGGYCPSTFGAKIYKLIKLKAKVVNILKIC